MDNFYLLSDQLYEIKHAPLAVAVTLAITGGDGSFRKGDVMDHMTYLIRDGRPFNGPDGYEIGRWDNRFSDVESSRATSDDMYYAWVDPDLWDYDPHCVLYTKEEFMTLFEDCCRNYVKAHPDRAEEFGVALAANGMSLKSKVFS
jgi:hypothetical protein